MGLFSRFQCKSTVFPLAAIVLVLLANNSGCQSVSQLCGNLVDSQLRRIAWSTLNADNFPQWVKDHYGLNPRRDRYRDDPAVVWSWSSVDREYAAYFRPGVKRILIKFPVNPPTVSNIMGCFGSPNTYQAYYRYQADAYEFNFAIWYFKDGLAAFRSYYTHESRTESIHDDTQLPNIVLVPPGTPTNMVYQAYAATSGPKVHDGEAKSLKPWPGKLTNLVIDVNPPYFGDN